MRPDDPDAIARAISDGEPVDWEALAASSGGDAEQLKRIERIADFHRRLHAGPDDGDAPDALPRTWGSFLLLEHVGRGASGDLFRAWDPELQREVALKLLRADAGSGVDAHRLLEEGRLLARVRHPHVVTVHGAQEQDGVVGLWMEFLRGPSLEHEAATRGRSDAPALIETGIALCRALDAVHACGLVHRDVKPANVVRESDGRIVLADFGLGLRFPPDGQAAPSGTPLYMAPEALAGASPAVTGDVYAAGVVMFFLATGRHPVVADTVAGLRDAHASGARASLAELRPDLPTALRTVIERAIASDPAARFPTAAALRAALEACSVETAGPGAPAGGARRARALIGVVAVAALIAVVAFLATRRPATVPVPAVPAGAEVAAHFVRLESERATILGDGDRVAPGDRLALEFTASRPSYVYVVNEDDAGEAYLLFPQPAYDTRNPLPAGATHRLPGAVGGEPRAWGVSSAGGREHFLVIASPEPLEDIEQELARLAAPAAPSRAGGAAEAPERLRGTGHLVPAPASAGTDAGPSALERVRRLVGSERDGSDVWSRRFVLESARREGAPTP